MNNFDEQPLSREFLSFPFLKLAPKHLPERAGVSTS